MNRGRALVLALALLGASPPPAPAAGLESSARLARELAASRRAEAVLRYTLPSLAGGPGRTVTGALALEAPDRVRLDVRGSGESLVARGDGGEWLQPSTKQLLRFGAGAASPALRWWRVLLGDAAGVRERKAGEGRYRLVQGEGAGFADSATVVLDARGLPARIEVAGPGGAMVYRLSGWRFATAKGAAAFRLAAPAGYETVDVP